MIANLMSKSRTTEVDGTAGRIISAYQKTTLNSDPYLEKIFGPLQNYSQQLTSAINRLKEKSTQQTNDEVRDEKITGLYYLVVSFSHHPDAGIRSAALNLLGVFENYGLEMKDESYTTQSALVNSLLNDFSEPKQQADIERVPQGARYIAALQNAQTNFEENRVAYEQARAEEGTLENATALKKEVVGIVNRQLVPYLNVMLQLDNATYGNFARIVNEIISENNETVKRRSKTDKPEETT